MLRGILSTLSINNGLFAKASSQNGGGVPSLILSQLKCQKASITSLISPAQNSFQRIEFSKNLFLKPEKLQTDQVRTVTKFSITTGRRKTVKTVVKRFFRLNWGIWIRTIAGRNHRRWSRTSKQRNNSDRHVFCNATQSRMLDKMVTKYWRSPKYYIEDPFEPYQTRENFYITRRKPWRPEGCDYE